MNDNYPAYQLHVELARAAYPSIATYVERAQRGDAISGLCGHMAVPISDLLLEYKRLGSGNVPKCQAARYTSTPFNCLCDECDVGLYVAEGRAGDRLNNRYRRAFINWVCRLADKPELLP